MELTPNQRLRLVETAKRLAQAWIQGLTPAEAEALGGHSRDALERQLGSACLEGFRIAKVEESLAGSYARMTPTAPEPTSEPEPTPDPDPLTKASLVTACRALGAPEEYIVHHLGTNRKPKLEEKVRVHTDLERIRSGETWAEVWTPETP